MKTSPEDLADLKAYAIEFSLVDKLIKKLEGTFSISILKPAIENLLELFSHELSSNPNINFE